MATRRSARAAVAAAVGVLLTTPWGGAAAVAGPAAPRDGVAAVIASYQARIPELMAQKHIPGLALALVDGDRVVWQQGFGSKDSHGHASSHRRRCFGGIESWWPVAGRTQPWGEVGGGWTPRSSTWWCGWRRRTGGGGT
jgi:hypothetical protein